MLSVNLKTPQEMQKIVAASARSLRLHSNLSQKTLSEKSGVSYGAVKKFEQTGQISLESLLKIALVLGCMGDFAQLFPLVPATSALSLDELIDPVQRKRGRQ